MVSDGWLRKYMRVAKAFGEDRNRCFSRKIGSVIVDPVLNKVLSMGMNGPARGVPKPDSGEYLREVVWPQATPAMVDAAGEYMGFPANEGAAYKEEIIASSVGCEVCPRRLLGIASGERRDLCPCTCSEKNAIFNAACSMQGAWLFLWANVKPCWDCSTAIVQVGIKKVFCVDGPEYGPSSSFILDKGGVEVISKPTGYWMDDGE